MTHKQQQEFLAMKKACVGLMSQVELLTRDLTEYAERYAALEARVSAVEPKAPYTNLDFEVKITDKPVCEPAFASELQAL